MNRIATLSDDPAPRQRILDAAFSLALKGGMETMNMRDVAMRAKVSTRTLHQHFPSKNFLLLSAFVERAVSTDFFPEVAGSGDPLERVLDAFRRSTEVLLALPQVASGIMAALVAPDERALPLLVTYRDSLQERAVRALAVGEATVREQAMARALAQVWFAAMAGWVTGAEKPESVLESVEDAARLMLGQ
ncbi:MAG: TetR/AcrR family transcriptional regulator [Marmoricola sp.]